VKPTPTPAVAQVHAAVRAAFEPVAIADADTAVRVAVALSGGRDSIVLLDALATLAADLHLALTAIHVHHGLSPNADAWAAFCDKACASRGVPLAVRRVDVKRAGGESPEAAARAVRYAVFAAADAHIVALGHHADDQAETVLLQLLRGAGPQGLAAMPLLRRSAFGPSLLRPFLPLPRATILAYAGARGLEFVDDESNADIGIKRNFLREEIVPRLATAFAGYPTTLVRAAAHQAESAQLLDALAILDAEGALDRNREAGPALDRKALAASAARDPNRARNLLRWFVRQYGLPAPSAARLAEMLDQLVHAAPDARIRLAHAKMELGIHRGRILVHAPPLAPYVVRWQGEAELELPHGTLEFAPQAGAGIAQSAMASATVTIRPRSGGERLRLWRGGPSRSLKNLLHDAGMPPWQRDSLPLVFCGDALAAVPGIGVDAAFQAAVGAPGKEVRWRPATAQR
jgi:tRNA(Ile)-lysidine synthase